MSEEFEFDRDELGRPAAEHQRLTGTEPKDEASDGMTRRDLLLKGGVGAAAVAGLGALAGTAAAKPAKSGGLHRHAAGDHPRRRVPDA